MIRFPNTTNKLFHFWSFYSFSSTFCSLYLCADLLNMCNRNPRSLHILAFSLSFFCSLFHVKISNTSHDISGNIMLKMIKIWGSLLLVCLRITMPFIYTLHIFTILVLQIFSFLCEITSQSCAYRKSLKKFSQPYFSIQMGPYGYNFIFIH